MSDEQKEKLNKFVSELERIVARREDAKKKLENAKKEELDENDIKRISTKIRYLDSKKVRLENAILNIIEESKK